MKHLLRKHEALASEYEAEAYGFYEAKHTFSTSPCGEATLHSTNGATSFFIHRRCASFAPQFVQEITKMPRRCGAFLQISTFGRNYLFEN